MKLSIILVTYNQKYFPRMCIEALEQLHVNFEYEIIVVDNNSKDESIDFLLKAKKEKRIKLIRNSKNLGFGKANNIGVKKAKGEYVLILNSDVLMKNNDLQELINFAEEKKEFGVIGPKLHYYNGQIQDSCRRNPSFLIQIIKRTPLRRISCLKNKVEKYTMKDFKHNKTIGVDIVTGACMLIKKDVFNKVGGFDERYFLFMEDFDLCREIKKLKLDVIYYHKVSLLHNHKRLSQKSLWLAVFTKVTWYHLISAIKYYWKWR